MRFDNTGASEEHDGVFWMQMLKKDAKLFVLAAKKSSVKKEIWIREDVDSIILMEDLAERVVKIVDNNVAIFVKGEYEDLGEVWRIYNQLKLSNLCTCEMNCLMRYGCRCGGR